MPFKEEASQTIFDPAGKKDQNKNFKDSDLKYLLILYHLLKMSSKSEVFALRGRRIPRFIWSFGLEQSVKTPGALGHWVHLKMCFLTSI